MAWYMPAAHAEQLDSDALAEKCPAEQRMQAALLALAMAEADPAGQLPEQAVAPALAWYMPAAQCVQIDAAAEKCPAAQRMHSALLVLA